MSLVQVKILAKRVAVISLSSPKQMNALTVKMGDDLATAFHSLDPKLVSSVVLTGEGDAFSAGGDFDFLRSRAKASREENIATMLKFYRLFLDPVRTSPFPVIAAVNGACVGNSNPCPTYCTPLK